MAFWYSLSPVVNGQAKTEPLKPNPVVAFDAMVLRTPFSGVENAVAGQAEALLQQAGAPFRFTVLWPAALRQPAPEPLCPNRVRRAGPRWRARALRLLWEQGVLPFRLRDMGARLLHAPAYLAPLASPCPTVLNVYDLHALDAPKHCRPLNRWNFRLFLPASIRNAARILVPSEHTRNAVIRRFPGVTDRIRTIPLGIHPRFRPDPTHRLGRERAALLPHRYLLCVGNIEPRKNLPLAVEALDRLRRQGHPDLGIVVAGHATMGDPAFERAICARRLEAAVVRLGYVPDEELPDLYAKAAAFVFPSLAEGFGLPPLEAMACGCPVLCADSKSLRQTTGQAALRFPPRDAGALADAAETILDAPALHAEWSGRALAHAAQYRWPVLIHRILAVYGEVLSQATGHEPV